MVAVRLQPTEREKGRKGIRVAERRLTAHHIPASMGCLWPDSSVARG
jgi:hypothetical protein